MSFTNKGGLSANPALAAIQKAKAEAAAAAKSRTVATAIPAKASDAAAGSSPKLGSSPSVRLSTSPGATSGTQKEGKDWKWWEKTDVGQLNDPSQDTKSHNTQGFTPQTDITGQEGSRKLDFNNMFQERSGSTPASPATEATVVPAATSPAAPTSIPVTTDAPSAEAQQPIVAAPPRMPAGAPSATSPPQGAAPDGGNGDWKWWSKMDVAGLNDATQDHAARKEKEVFQPQFHVAGGTSHKLDFSNVGSGAQPTANPAKGEAAIPVIMQQQAAQQPAAKTTTPVGEPQQASTAAATAVDPAVVPPPPGAAPDPENGDWKWWSKMDAASLNDTTQDHAARKEKEVFQPQFHVAGGTSHKLDFSNMGSGRVHAS